MPEREPDDPLEVDWTNSALGARNDAELAEIRERATSLRWWRRPRELRRQLAGMLVATALASVLLVGGLNFVAARALLVTGTQDQLVGVGQARARTIDNGVDRLLGQVSAISGELGVVSALEGFRRDFAALDDEELTDGELAELDAFYRDGIVRLYDDLDLGPVTVDEFLPSTDAGRYVQYHYTVVPSNDGVDPRSVADAGDGSAYSATHALHHPSLEAMFAFASRLGDALLVDVDGNVVYTAEKRIDVGTNLLDGPYADSKLADAIVDRLPRVRSGNALLVDLELYAPAQGRPVFFVTAAVQNDTETIGVLAVEVPVDALSAITTSNEQWEQFGLRSGESYVVGTDLVLRSESRSWIEDPDRYLRRADPERATLIEKLGTPVGLQIVDTRSVGEALDGEMFSGTSENYLGVDTFSFAEPIAVGGLNLVVVVDVPLSDARAPLFDYARRIGLVLLIILPLAAAVGLWLARRLTRPIGPVLSTATAIVAGERQPTLPDLGRDEFGDLARRLGQLASELGQREQALSDEYDERRQLLLAVLPPRMLDESGAVTGDSDLLDIATAVAITIDMATDELQDDEERQAHLLDQIATAANAISADRSIERVRASADGYLYLAGVGDDGDGADEALDFVSEHLARFAELRGREDVEISMRIGVATGPIATGVLASGGLTYGAWGLPIRQAAALAAMSKSNGVLIDASTAEAVSSGDGLVRAEDVIALDGEAMDLYTVPEVVPVPRDA